MTDAIGKETYIIKVIPQLHIEEKLHKEVLFKSSFVHVIQDSQIIWHGNNYSQQKNQWKKDCLIYSHL